MHKVCDRGAPCYGPWDKPGQPEQEPYYKEQSERYSIPAEQGEDTASLHGVHTINKQSSLKPEPEGPVALSERFIYHTGT
jgi:hypothetical protein